MPTSCHLLLHAGCTQPGLHLQYAHARIRSVLDKVNAAPGPVTLTSPNERALAVELLAYEPLLATVVDTLEFHKLTADLHGLASTFSGFYDVFPVWRAPSAEKPAGCRCAYGRRRRCSRA